RVSRRHASIEERDESYYLRDEGSTNGTSLNGVRIRGEALLQSRDRIGIGRTILEFAIVVPPPKKRWQEEPVPERVGRFRIEERLGGGGMGVVYRAIDGESGRQVALKCIRVDPGRGGEVIGSLQNSEATLAREVRHPTIVEVYDSGIEEGTPYIAMEFVSGESLIQRVRRAALSLAEGVQVILQIAAGLAAAHRMGVVHGDIKPDNILLVPDAGRPRDVEARILEEPDPSAASSEREIAAAPLPRPEDFPLVGRELELAFLTHGAERALEGRGSLAIVRGPAGVGKRTLLRAFAERWTPSAVETRRADDPALWGGGERGEEGPAPMPVRGVFVIEGLESPECLRAVTSQLERLRESPVLLIATVGESIEADPSALRSLIGEARRLGVLREVTLKPFSRHQVFRCLLAVLGDADLARELHEDMWRVSGGVPARLREALDRALDAGAIAPDSGGRLRYRRRSREILAAEGQRLLGVVAGYGKLARSALERCAFLGDEWTFDQALRFTGVDATTLYLIVGQALRDGVLTGGRNTVHTFGNERLRLTLAERAVREAPAAKLHAAAAEALAAGAGADRPAALAARGRHLRALGDLERALRALLEGLFVAAQLLDADRLRAIGNEVLGIAHEAARHEKIARRIRAAFQTSFGRPVNPYDIVLRLVESGSRPRIKITDFGISFRAGEDEDVRQRNVGTPRYMSPEQVAGKPLDGKADIFALAVIAHEVISGASPFPGAKGRDVMQKNLNEPFPPLRSPYGPVPERLGALVEAMARKDPQARPAAEEVLRELMRVQLDLWAHGG
ncbi:MAG: protein kinase, partial [Planctomycetes bacterium]|nr:protein kinase [Planctomycetota bacterium]